ncbi:MAG TPA: adenosine deaminase, partial [Alphaproteobacteria bacterium]|nr:adenosine deaminase [Alphaproteobacteria bacterium]
MAGLVQALPKAELHLHIEGTLEPEMVFDLARRNGVKLRHKSAAALREAYDFANLQEFLDLYYEGAQVLREARDFRQLAWAYFTRMAAENVRHVEIFFDPQTHTGRGVDFGVVIDGLASAIDGAAREFGMSARLIMCFLRDRSVEEAMRTLEAALPYRRLIAAVGLDSAERDNPPGKFAEVFARARAANFRAVAHAGEEGPPEYISEALDVLRVVRIDHGVACERDTALMTRLAVEQVPLTVCPLSNVKLRVFERIEDHNLKRLLDAGLCATVNSDDPAYFGGYLSANILATHSALG